MIGTRKKLGNAALVASLAAIGVVCLLPAGSRVSGFRACVLCSNNGALASNILNVVLFMPFGAAVWMRTGSWKWAVLLGVLVSVGVEGAQTRIPGRFSTLEDLLANGLGALLGGVGAATWDVWFRPRRTNPLPVVSWTLCVLSTLVVSGLLFEPTVPEGRIYAQWTPALEGRPPYAGHVLDARVGGEGLPNGPYEELSTLLPLLRAEPEYAVTFVAGEQSNRRVPIFRLVTRPERRRGWREVTQLGAFGEDAFIRVRLRADDWLMDRPEIRLPGALAGVSPGDTLVVQYQPAPDGSLGLEWGGTATVHGFTLAQGWSLLAYAAHAPDPWYRVGDLVWLAVLFGPLGWWAMGPRSLFGAATLAGGGLLFVPTVTSALPTPPPLILFACAVAGFAYVARRRLDPLSGDS